MFKMQFFFGILFAIILMSKHVSSNAEIQEKESAHVSDDYGNSHFFSFFNGKCLARGITCGKQTIRNTVIQCALFSFFSFQMLLIC